ncbi:MAG: YicC family protein [Candidatus Omnitrophica bacterium]|nr:YicC family protein [Candidatus Omnitrophota bacterium]MBU0895167.1 YicC family protein [Candidatus Omnitrophota bacterium]MBU1809106.1 YicC family protein [Candidatus Omnitrophota bacterium]
MVRSMTGFGRGSVKVKSGKIAVEIKTINHKFFDVACRLPTNIAALEEKIKEVIQKRIMRGKVSISLTCDGKLLKDERFVINRDVAKNYHDELLRLKKYLGLAADITIKELVALPGVLSYDPGDGNLSRAWPKVKSAVERALTSLVADRAKEGKALALELSVRSRKIVKLLAFIRSRAHLNIDEYKRRFESRVRALTGGRDIDMGRLEMEVAIFAKNCDISEEITRLKNHLENFGKTISGGEEVGKKLDFIAQELHREINTIGSKASDFKISKNVIEIKSEIEKIREQAKNLE